MFEMEAGTRNDLEVDSHVHLEWCFRALCLERAYFHHVLKLCCDPCERDLPDTELR